MLGVYLMVRFLYFYFTGDGQGHVQSLVVSSVLLTAGMLLFILAVFSDIMRINRKMMQNMFSEWREETYGAQAARDGGRGALTRKH